jgi:hypothetical protein
MVNLSSPSSCEEGYPLIIAARAFPPPHLNILPATDVLWKLDAFSPGTAQLCLKLTLIDTLITPQR